MFVIGGTGLVGTKLVKDLGERGHDVFAAAHNAGVNTVNTITHEGLAKALGSAEVLVDAANAPVWEDKPVLEFVAFQLEDWLGRSTAQEAT